MWLEGQFIISDNAQVFVLFQDIDSLSIYDGRREVRGNLSKIIIISSVLATLMLMTDNLHHLV